MSTTYGSCILTIDAKREPDWDALRAFAQTCSLDADSVAEYEGFPDGTPEEHARQELLDAVDRIRRGWNEAKDNEGHGFDYEIRTVRGIDLHILYDDPNDPVELWDAEEAVTRIAGEGAFKLAGFDD